MPLTPEESQELAHLLKIKKQYEGIARTSTNIEQKKRAMIELGKIMSSIDVITGGQDIDTLTMTHTSVSEDIYHQYKFQKVFSQECQYPNIHDKDLIVLANIFTTLDQVFFPALSDLNIKLQYRFAKERSSHVTILSILKRNFSFNIETRMNYTQTIDEQIRQQMNILLNKQKRMLLYEGNHLLKKSYTLWNGIYESVDDYDGGCANPDSELQTEFHHTASLWPTNSTVRVIICETVLFLRESLSVVKIPA